MDARVELCRVDDPEFSYTKGGVEGRLAPEIITQARIGYFDDEPAVAAVSPFLPTAFG